MRLLSLLLIVGCLAGCSTPDVVMQDPRSGDTVTCKGDTPFNPWSQADGCVGNHEAQGWVRAQP